MDIVMSVFSNFPKRIDDLIRSASRDAGFVLFGSLFLTSVLLVIAYGIGNHLTTFDGTFISGKTVDERIVDKQVGYWFSLNWSVVSLLMPCALYFFLSARSNLLSIANDLAKRRMIVRRSTDSLTDNNPVQFDVLNEDQILKLLERHRKFGCFALICVLLLVCIFGFIDFYRSVLASEAAAKAATVSLTHPDYEFDWAVAHLFDSKLEGHRTPILLFGALAFLIVPIFGAGLVYGIYIYIFFLINGFRKSLIDGDSLIVVVDISSQDARDRMGFEIFEPFIRNLIWGLYCIFTCLMLMSHQNMYLRSPEHENIYRFYIGNFENYGLEYDAILNLITFNQGIVNTQSIVSIITTMTVLMFLVFWAFTILRGIAHEAREQSKKSFLELKRLRSEKEGDILNGSVAECLAKIHWKDVMNHDIGLIESKINNMKIWPLSWGKLNHAIILLLLVGCATIFPGLLAVGVAAIFITILDKLRISLFSK